MYMREFVTRSYVHERVRDSFICTWESSWLIHMYMSEWLVSHLNHECHEHTCESRRYRALLRMYRALVWKNTYLLRKYCTKCEKHVSIAEILHKMWKKRIYCGNIGLSNTLVIRKWYPVKKNSIFILTQCFESTHNQKKQAHLWLQGGIFWLTKWKCRVQYFWFFPPLFFESNVHDF